MRLDDQLDCCAQLKAYVREIDCLCFYPIAWLFFCLPLMTAVGVNVLTKWIVRVNPRKNMNVATPFK